MTTKASFTLLSSTLCLLCGCMAPVDSAGEPGDDSTADDVAAAAKSSLRRAEDADRLEGDEVRRMFASVKLSAPDLEAGTGGVIPPGAPGFDPICPTTPDLYLTVRGVSSGWSNVFGDFTEEQVACLHPATNELIHGRSTITGGKGDTALMNFTVRSPTSFPNEPPPSHTLLGVFDIVGGTSRWSGISGNGFIKGHGDGPDSPDTRSVVYSGTVYLP